MSIRCGINLVKNGDSGISFPATLPSRQIHFLNQNRLQCPVEKYNDSQCPTESEFVAVESAVTQEQAP
jgi:hypothetical protein